MKKNLLLLIATVLMLFPLSLSVADTQEQVQLDQLMQKWISALTTENIEAMASCYWPEATKIIYNPNRTSSMLEGIEEIRENQQRLFDKFDYPSMHLQYPNPKRFLPGSVSEEERRPVYIYDNKKRGFIDIFFFEKRSGEYRIIQHLLLINPK